MVGGYSLMLFWFIFIIGIILLLCWCFHIRIDFKSFLRRSFRAKRSLCGTYVFAAEQGKGKTLSLATYVFKHNTHIKVFSNVYFNNLEDFTYFSEFEDIYSILNDIDNGVIDNNTKQIVIIWDELFSLLNKSSKLNKEIKSFLSQLRKRKIIFLTTCQSWPDIPLEFRRLCRFEIDCNVISLFNSSLLINVYKDAERMKWSDIEQEHIAPIVWTRLSKTNKIIADSYDTYQVIQASNY